MSSDVFIISSARDRSPVSAVRRALELPGIQPSRVQDAIFGSESRVRLPDIASLARSAGLDCPLVGITSGLRALSFGAASILTDEAGLIMVAGFGEEGCIAILLASAETVGMLNLFPRARLVARSLKGFESALRLAGLTSSDVQIWKEGDSLVLVDELITELESQPARWGLLSSLDLIILLERI